MTTWTEIDEPLLRWLLEREDDLHCRGRLQLTIRPQVEMLPDFGGIDNTQVDAALVRLSDHRLIWGGRHEATGYALWSRVRLRARGLIILGEWPDLDRVASAAGIQTLIAALAEETSDPNHLVRCWTCELTRKA